MIKDLDYNDASKNAFDKVLYNNDVNPEDPITFPLRDEFGQAFHQELNNQLDKQLDLRGGNTEAATAAKEQVTTAVAKAASQSIAGKEGSLMKSFFNIDFTNPDELS